MLRVALEVQLNRLDVLMGVQPGTYAQELALSSPVATIPAIGNGTPADVLRRRPDAEINAEGRHEESSGTISFSDRLLERNNMTKPILVSGAAGAVGHEAYKKLVQQE
ncbi:hypothetical protein [Brytella acorum]|uniref:Uncharacterized protein n=1 Tax=Brytella acorum TaxID=2959299 RepID=A0AA35VDN0_9PROT|nr:hypothetical protein [Brytella acorum]MDF3625912.1 hypothetical protein [Brytella acorum]CAI9122242.1 hypothetical protein LMG32879_003102 [Brytella acorum]